MGNLVREMCCAEVLAGGVCGDHNGEENRMGVKEKGYAVK